MESYTPRLQFRLIHVDISILTRSGLRQPLGDLSLTYIIPGQRVLLKKVSEKLSKLDVRIWNADSQSFGWAKSEAKTAAHGLKFCTSVPVP